MQKASCLRQTISDFEEGFSIIPLLG